MKGRNRTLIQLAMLCLLAMAPAQVLAGVSYVFPAQYRWEVDQNANVRYDYARLGAFNNTYWRTWAEFDLTPLEGSTATGVGLRVYNDDGWFGDRITSLRYSRYRPSMFLYPGSLLNMQNTFANKYDGFQWTINTGGAWTPAEGAAERYHRPTAGEWESYSRENGNSIIEDIQNHIDSGKHWFTLGFGALGHWPSPNLRLPDHYDPASIYLEVTTEDILIVFIPEKNLGGDTEGGETAPMSCKPINFATGNKYVKETDLVLPGPGLPLTFTRHYNSQSEVNGPLGFGWTGTFSESVSQTGDRVVLRSADGAEVHFIDDGQGRYLSEGGRLRVIEPSNGGFLLTEPDGRTTAFDAAGKPVRIADLNGNKQILTYAGGRLSSVEDNYGRALTFGYDADGRLTELVSPVGRFVYRYEGDNLVGVTHPDGSRRTYAYADPNDPHNLTRLTDENGQYAQYEYDVQDRATASEDIGGIDRVTVGYEDGPVRTMTDSLGNTITYELTEINGVARIASSSGSCGSCRSGAGAQFEMTDRRRIARKTDAEGNVTTYTYDDRGNLTAITEAAGTPEERTTAYAWDPDLNRVTEVVRQSVAAPGDAAVTAIDYDTAGNPVAIAESGFSAAGAVDRATTLTYDDLGRVTAVDGPRTDVVDATLFDYYPNDPGYGPDRGRLMRVVDAAGHETRLADYTPWGKPQKVTDADGTVTTLAYDAAGRIVSRTTAGLTTEAGYGTPAARGPHSLLHLHGREPAGNGIRRRGKPDFVPLRFRRQPDRRGDLRRHR